MMEAQKIVKIPAVDLLEHSREYHSAGFRLVQICCTRLDGGWELTYSFDRDYQLVNLRVTLASCDSPVPSLSAVYWSAFLYENEIAELFGIKFSDMVVDYQGNFYRTQVKQPFSRLPENNPEVK